MAAGLQVWEANGKLTFDTNMHVARFLGIVQPGLGQSVYYHDGLLRGTPYYFATPANEWATNASFGAGWPQVSFSGNRMIVTRTNPYGQLATPAFNLWYGVH